MQGNLIEPDLPVDVSGSRMLSCNDVQMPSQTLELSHSPTFYKNKSSVTEFLSSVFSKLPLPSDDSRNEVIDKLQPVRFEDNIGASAALQTPILHPLKEDGCARVNWVAALTILRQKIHDIVLTALKPWFVDDISAGLLISSFSLTKFSNLDDHKVLFYLVLALHFLLLYLHDSYFFYKLFGLSLSLHEKFLQDL